jgi:hypothetical protein
MLTVIGKMPDLSRISAALFGRHDGTGRAGHGLGSLLSTHTVAPIPPTGNLGSQFKPLERAG